MTTFLREVCCYFRPGAPTRQLVQNVVAEQIRTHQPTVVIAHSLGSVIAYETMWANPDLHTALLITLGSPLGLKSVIFDRLRPQPHNGRGERPPSIDQWINVADPGDIVAIPRPFTSRFAIEANHDQHHIHWRDFHSAGRYLAAPPTINAISTHPRQRSAGPSGNASGPTAARRTRSVRTDQVPHQG